MIARNACNGSAGQSKFGSIQATPGGAPTPTEGLTTRSVYLLMADLNLMDRDVLASARDESYAGAAHVRRSDG